MMACFFLLLFAAFLLLALLCLVNPRWAFQSRRGKGVGIYSGAALLAFLLAAVTGDFTQGELEGTAESESTSASDFRPTEDEATGSVVTSERAGEGSLEDLSVISRNRRQELPGSG